LSTKRGVEMGTNGNEGARTKEPRTENCLEGTHALEQLGDWGRREVRSVQEQRVGRDRAGQAGRRTVRWANGRIYGHIFREENWRKSAKVSMVDTLMREAYAGSSIIALMF